MIGGVVVIVEIVAVAGTVIVAGVVDVDAEVVIFAAALDEEVGICAVVVVCVVHTAKKFEQINENDLNTRI